MSIIYPFSFWIAFYSRLYWNDKWRFRLFITGMYQFVSLSFILVNPQLSEQVQNGGVNFLGTTNIPHLILSITYNIFILMFICIFTIDTKWFGKNNGKFCYRRGTSKSPTIYNSEATNFCFWKLF